MYESHFTNCLLGFLAYMNIAFCWPEQGFQLTLAGLLVTNSYHPPQPSIANSYMQDAKLPDLCILLPLEFLFLVLSNLQCGAPHYICVTLFCTNKVNHTSSTLPLITDPSQPNLHQLYRIFLKITKTSKHLVPSITTNFKIYPAMSSNLSLGSQMHTIHHLLVCADDINSKGKGINGTKNITIDSLIASNTAGIEVNKL
jgi:hypothetical protein